MSKQDNKPKTQNQTITDQINFLLASAKQKHATGNLAEAGQAYAQILGKVPNEPTALYLLGLVFLQGGQLEKAVEFLKKSLSVEPSNAEANNNLGVALNAAGQQTEAEASYRKAIEIKPGYAAAHKNLGALLSSSGRLSEGLKHYQQTVALAPQHVEAHKAIGDILVQQQNYEEALASYLTAKALNPTDADLLTATGSVLQFLNRYREAIKLHSQAVNFAPNDERHWRAFGECVSRMSFSSTNANLESALLKLLEKNDPSPASLMFPIISALRHRQEFSELLDNANEVPKNTDTVRKNISVLSASQLFMTLLTRVPIADLRVERLLTSLRRSILEHCFDAETTDEQIAFVAALAQQLFINEYAYNVTPEETKALTDVEEKVASQIREGGEIPAILWLIVGSYKPLKDCSWKNHIYPTTAVTSDVFHLQITAPETEKELGSLIPRLTNITDTVSQSVRDQYEENPYPRWLHTTRLTPKPIKEVLSSAPLLFDLDDYVAPTTLDVLVAGCGTGQHAIQAASRFTNTQLTAVDLSLSSLSYAKRKTQEMGIKNIEYLQADILELDKIDKQFDVIECGGVLHHMAEPIKGWEVLVRLLRRGGLMKIGLYSEAGRPDIIAARKFIDNGGYSNSPDEMRRCRQDIINAAEDGDQQLIQLCMRSDFYSLSSCRDLIFHVQEHRFTIPQISDALARLGLTFLGFETPTPQSLAQFQKENPSCPQSKVLERWHDFEERYPDTFRGMYQLWCLKSEG